MPTLFVLQGLPGSGKTTKARDMAAKSSQLIRVNRDYLRAMLGLTKFSKAGEAKVTQLRDAMIMCALCNGFDAISDDTNLNPKTVDQLEALAKSCHAKFVLDKSLLNVPIQTCVQRDKARAESVGVQVILDMHTRYLLKPVLWQESLPSAIVVDIDGTLAHAKHRNVYDTTKYSTDTPDAAVCELVRDQAELGVDILITTGRSFDYHDDCVKWLCHTAGLSRGSFRLLMRPSGDTRPDWQVKTELYNEHIKDKYNVKFVLDDRDSVVLTWRALGLKCLQCNYGDF